MLGFGVAMSPSGNTMPREHDANPTICFSPQVFFVRWQPNARIRSACVRKMETTDGANQSLASMDIWVCNVPFWEHESSALWACSVPLGEHQV